MQFTSKKISLALRFTSAALATFIALGATANASPIERLSEYPEPIQYQICGDLLAGLSLAGLRDLGSRGMTIDHVEEDERVSMVFHTAAASILLMEKAQEEITSEGVEFSREVAIKIEASPEVEHIKTALQCSDLVGKWLKEGEIIEAAYEQAVFKAYSTLPALKIDPPSP